MENEFSRSFSTLQGTSAREKYGEFIASYLLLKKFMSGSLFMSLEILFTVKLLVTLVSYIRSAKKFGEEFILPFHSQLIFYRLTLLRKKLYLISSIGTA